MTRSDYTNKNGFVRKKKSFTERFACWLLVAFVIGLVFYGAIQLWLYIDNSLYSYNQQIFDVEVKESKYDKGD